jgi:hypothetical protein
MREMEDRTQYLVHFPTLLQLARKLQLEMVEIVNFIDFYEDHKKSHEAALTEIMGWTKTNKKLFPNQLELIGTRDVDASSQGTRPWIIAATYVSVVAVRVASCCVVCATLQACAQRSCFGNCGRESRSHDRVSKHSNVCDATETQR